MPEPENKNEAVSAVAVGSTVAQRFGEGLDGGAGGGMPRTKTRVLDRTSDASMLLPSVGDQVGNYVLKKKLGEGAHGAVYRAHRVGLEEHRVALKIIPATRDEVALVRQELVTLATVVHPNIVQLTDHGAEAGFAWFSMPLYEGAPLDAKLSERFKAGQTLTLEEAHEIFLPLAGALAALHAAGFRHQDVKPENVFLARFADKEHPILLDLGVAIAKDNQRFLAGTREYFAPEQLDAFLAAMRIRPLPGGPQLGEAMDVYALATTLLLSILGPEHVPGATLLREDMVEKDLPDVWEEIERAQKEREREPIPPKALKGVSAGAGKEIAAAFKRWFARDPKERPSAAEMAKELDVLLSNKRHVEARRRRTARVAMAAAGVLFLGAPAAYAGGHYAITLQECTQKVLQDAKEKGTVSQTLDQCQAHEASLESQGASCQKSLDEANAAKAQIEKDIGGKLSSCTNADKQLTGLLGICQGERDTALGKDKTCEASLGAVNDQLRACGAARDAVNASLVACNGSVASCNASLAAANTNAARCAGDLGRAQADEQRAAADLSQCKGDLGKCNADRGDCVNHLGTCTSDLQACKSSSGSAADLAACKASLTTAQNDLQACKASGGACPAQLQACNAALLNCRVSHGR